MEDNVQKKSSSDGTNPDASELRYRISFFSSNKGFTNIPDDVITVQSSIRVDVLNDLVNELLNPDASRKDYSPVTFDFLVGSTILRSSLEDYIKEFNISAESVIKIECILRENPPKPYYSVRMSDWIGAIKASKNFVACSSYDGSLNIYSTIAYDLLAQSKVHSKAIKCLCIIEQQDRFKLASGSSDQRIIIQNIELDGKRAHLLTKYCLKGHKRSVECLDVNKENTRLISGGFDHELKVWNIEEDDTSTLYDPVKNASNEKIAKTSFQTKVPMVTLASHKDAIVGTSWISTSKNEAVTVGWDNKMLIWDLELAGPINTFNGTKSFTSVSCSSIDPMLITGSTDPVVRLWDPRSKEGSLVKQSFVGHKTWISSVCFSPSLSHLFISSSFDKVTKMWDIRSSKTALYDLLGHSDRILCCDWSRNEIILTGSADCSMQVYHRDNDYSNISA